MLQGFALVGAVLWPFLVAAYDVIPIEVAVSQQLVSASTKATNDPGSFSSHFGRCMQVTLVSNKRAPLIVRISPGQRLMPQADFTQEMIVTEEQILTLYPGDTQQVALFAMCGERADGSPGEGEDFLIGEIARQDIRDMAAFIYKKNYQHSTGQEAMWVVTDDSDLSNITDPNTFVANDLRQKAAILTGQPFVPYIPTAEQNGLSSISGQFHYRVRQQGFGTLQLYDPNGDMVHMIFERMPLKPGTYTFKFNAERISLQTGTYKLKLFINGHLRKEKGITI